MNRILQTLCLSGLAALAAAVPAGAQAAYSFYGTTAGGSTFNRPNTTLEPTPTLSGKTVRYSSQALFTNSNGTCSFVSVQESGFDGVLYLYSGAFDPANPLSHLVAASDNGTQGVHFSSFANIVLSGNQSYYLVTAGGEAAAQGTFTSFVSCTGATRILAGDGAMPSYDGRYGDSGIVWFFTPASFELMIKIVDGCSLNNRYWVFLAALTNVEFHVTVYDTWTETTKLYDNVLGVSAAAITDTNAFQTCP